MKNWLPDELAWLGFIVTAMAGGVVGFIKAYEQAGVETSVGSKFWAIARRMIMGAFAGYMIYLLSTEYSWSLAWGHVLSGMVGIFAAEFFEVLWVIGRARLQAMIGK